MKLLLLLTSLIFSITFHNTFAAKKKIGICFDDSIALRWNVEQFYLAKKINEYGGEAIFRFAAGNPDVQVQQIEEMIEQKVEVIVVVANDGEKVAPVIDKAFHKGIKVIAYDRLIKNCHLEYYISFDNEEVGKIMAEECIRQQPLGKYVIIGGPKKDNNSVLLHNGYLKALEHHIETKNIEIVEDVYVKEWINVEAFTLILNHLQDGKDVDVIIASNDNLALGAREAIDLMGMDKKIVISGQDAEASALDRIDNNLQSFTIYKPIKNLAKICGELSMEIALDHNTLVKRDMKIINNGSYKVNSILLNSILVNKENSTKIKKEINSYQHYINK